jgi:hypothetical protein
VNAPPGMSCESCRDLLIELACDELPASTAAEVRAHALRCERCGPELEKLGATLRVSRNLPLLTPSPEVERRVMQAARDAIARRARGPAREASVPSGGGLSAWFARLGSFAMSPQVAMASVLLLVVGIGLYALPLGQRAPESAALRVAEDEAPTSELAPASPSAAATGVPTPEPAQEPVPADRLAERSEHEEKQARAAMDKASVPGEALRAAKGSARAKSAEAAPKAFPESQGVSPTESKARVAKPAPSKMASGAALDDAFGDLGSGARGGGGAAKPARPASAAPAEESVGSEGMASNRQQAPYTAAPPAAAPAPARAAAPIAKRKAEAESAEPVAASEAPTAATAPATSKKEKDGSSTALIQGIAAARRGEHVLAQQLLQPLLASSNAGERAEARLWLARSLRERGDCARALEHYRVLTQPVTAPRGVLEEAADCQERVGNTAAASKLRSRAALPGEKK